MRLSSRPIWSTQWISGQPTGQCRKTLSPKQTKRTFKKQENAPNTLNLKSKIHGSLKLKKKLTVSREDQSDKICSRNTSYFLWYILFSVKYYKRTDKTAQKVKALVAKPDNRIHLFISHTIIHPKHSSPLHSSQPPTSTYLLPQAYRNIYRIQHNRTQQNQTQTLTSRLGQTTQ